MADLTIQKAADIVVKEWATECSPRGIFIAEKLLEYSNSGLIPPDIQDKLGALCRLNTRLGFALNLFLLKLGPLQKDSQVAKELLGKYREIQKVMKNEYFTNLNKLAKELRSEEGLEDLSDEVKALSKGLSKIQASLDKIRSILKSYEKK